MQLRATRLTAISHAARRAVAPAAFSPATLFAAGEQGIWLDPSDFSTMFQDAAGTVPVTAVEQPVGRILDKSGRGNHATQATATSRPILRQDAGGRYYLFFDGIDDSLVTGTITPGTDKVQVFAGVRKITDQFGTLIELSGNASANPGSFGVFPFGNLGPGNRSYATVLSGTTSTGSMYNGFVAPITNTLSFIFDIAEPNHTSEIVARVNGSIVASLGTGALSTSAGVGNFLAYPISIGRRINQSSLSFSGHLYQLVSRFGPNLSADQITQAETFFNQKTGAY